MSLRPAHRILSALTALSISLLGGCGDGTVDSTTPISTDATTSTNSSHASALVHLNFVVPQKVASGEVRSPQYVSASTHSLTIIVTPEGGTAQSPIYVACTATCAASFQAPVGSDGISLLLTDGINGSGNQLSLSTATVNVAANAANTFNLTANPVVDHAVVTLGSARIAGGTAVTVPVTVTAFDADGNTIVGPGAYVDATGNPLTLSLSATNALALGGGAVTLSATTVSAPSAGPIVASYNGSTVDHATISLASSRPLPQINGTDADATLGVTPTVQREYAVPTAGSGLQAVTVGPDGNIWFTERTTNRIGTVTSSGTINEFSLPTANSGPNSIATGPDGNLWITEYNANQIARMTTTGMTTEWPVPTAFSQVNSITPGPDGNLYFTEPLAGVSKIGRITTSGVFTEFACPTVGCGPFGITAGSDGALWFTEYDGNNIGRMTTAGTFSEYPIPTAGVHPGNITLGPDGNVWFMEFSAAHIGRVSPNGTVTEFSEPNFPYALTAGHDGDVWYTCYGGATMGRVAPDGTTTQVTLPGGYSADNGITSSADGTLWFTQATGNAVGRLTY